MNAVNRLRRDHKILRSKLDVLEAALKMGPETWFVLREVCFTLSRQLRDHIKREEDLVAACRQAMTPTALAEVAVEHHDEPVHLRTINWLFAFESNYSLERLTPELQGVIRGLRRHMDEEERKLFPIFEKTLADKASTFQVSGPPSRFSEEMTVSHVVKAFPKTEPVFERLFISVLMEGCTCLDEVAWRHGMDSRELLEALEDAIPVCGYAQGEVAKTHAQEMACVSAKEYG